MVDGDGEGRMVLQVICLSVPLFTYPPFPPSPPPAIENYLQAADFFNSENNKSSANDALQKTAFLLTTSRGAADPSLDNYARAAKIFEEVSHGRREGGREGGREAGWEGGKEPAESQEGIFGFSR